MNFLLEHNFDVALLNPISTDHARKAKVRKTMTDKSDTLTICNVLQSRNYTKMTKSKLVTRESKQLTRYRQEIMTKMNASKNQLQASIDLVFPEYNSLFKTKYSKSYMAVLKVFSSSTAIASADTSKLSDLLATTSKQRFSLPFATELQTQASESIGQHNLAVETILKHCIQTVEMFQEQMKVLDKKIEELATTLNSPIFTILGIGLTTGMSILSELRDIKEFESASKLVAFAGVDPAVYQSGAYNAEQTAISKRGSPYLRLSLYQAALPVCTFNATFKNYYNLKRSQGKSHRCAQGHVVRKMIRVIYKLLTENINFSEEMLK